MVLKKIVNTIIYCLQGRQISAFLAAATEASPGGMRGRYPVWVDLRFVLLSLFFYAYCKHNVKNNLSFSQHLHKLVGHCDIS